MVYDTHRNRLVLFGGIQTLLWLGDTWEWDGGTAWQLRAQTGPPVRHGHGMAYDPQRRRVVLFGGAGFQSRLNDTWEWDGTTWTQVPATISPSPRQGQVMATATLQHKKVEDADSAATNQGSTLAVSTVTVGNARNTDFKPLWRYRLVITGTNTYDWIHFRLLAPQWERS